MHPKGKEVDFMKFNIKGLNLSLYDSMKEKIEKKLEKLSKFFPEETTAEVTLSTQKDNKTIEVTIPVRGGLIRAEETSSDFTVSLDSVLEVLERQIRRHRTRLIDRTQSADPCSSLFEDDDQDIAEDSIRIEKVKRFNLKPMDAEEACLQMDLLGHSFFVFKDAETDETCVVYRRKNGTYGLIEPED